MAQTTALLSLAPPLSPCRGGIQPRVANGGLLALARGAAAAHRRPCRLGERHFTALGSRLRGCEAFSRPVGGSKNQGGPTTSSSWDEIQEEEDHRSSQVALLALVPIGLMSLKWAVSTGPAALAIPLVLLAFPIAGSGLRQLLAEGVSMAIRCTTWLQSHQTPRQQQQALSNADHTHHHSSGNDTALLQRSPGTSAAPTYAWGAAPVATGAAPPAALPQHATAAHHLHPHSGAAAAMQHSAAAPVAHAASTVSQPVRPAMAVAPSSPVTAHRQPTGAWMDVPTPRMATAAPTSWPQQQYPTAAVSRASPGRQPLPPAADHHHQHHHRNSAHHAPHAAPQQMAAYAAPAPQHGLRPSPPAALPATAASSVTHVPPTARPANLPPPSTLQQLADVQQCEDVDWEVDARRQAQSCHASCAGAAAAVAPAGRLGVQVAGERSASPAGLGTVHHTHGSSTHGVAHPPRGPAASPRVQSWP